MTFVVPSGQERFFDRVRQQFDSLIRANVIMDVFTETELARWVSQFRTNEERYLAAHLLNSAVIRSSRMVESSLRQIIDLIAPTCLRELGLHDVTCIDTFHDDLKRDKPRLPVRFMAVDGARLDSAAGNSGDSVLRKFGVSFQIGDGYRLRSDDPSSFQPSEPLLIVLVDDVLGTGSQFIRFIDRYQLNPSPGNVHLLYAPLLATSAGLDEVRKNVQDFRIWPIEVLGPSADFFFGLPDSPDVWSRDGSNQLVDVCSFYEQMMDTRGVPRETRYSQNLTVIMHDRCPNNTLRVYWHDSTNAPVWHALKAR